MSQDFFFENTLYSMALNNEKCTNGIYLYVIKSELSNHIWRLNELGLACDVYWKIIDEVKQLSPTSKSCKLCTLERYYLICRPDLCTLNKNKEFSDERIHKQF